MKHKLIPAILLIAFIFLLSLAIATPVSANHSTFGGFVTLSHNNRGTIASEDVIVSCDVSSCTVELDFSDRDLRTILRICGIKATQEFTPTMGAGSDSQSRSCGRQGAWFVNYNFYLDTNHSIGFVDRTIKLK